MDLVESPIGIPSNWDDAPIPPGDSRLALLAVFLIGRLSDEDKTSLALFLTARLSIVKVSTSCSGTDAPILMWQALIEGFQLALNVTIELEQLYACERNPEKRDFLSKAWPSLPKVFTDVADLASDTAQVHDGSCHPVGSFGSFHYSGFPCASASSLNLHASIAESIASEMASMLQARCFTF